MIDSLYLAWRYLAFSPLRTLSIVACVTTIVTLPLALDRLLDESERELMSRAQTTPLLVGSRGSALDLTLNALYFGAAQPGSITMQRDDDIAKSGLAAPIPLNVRFAARGFPVVGTTVDYFDFRHLKIDAGRAFALLGDCVLGATVANRLGLSPGDFLVTDPETAFDLAGAYPLKMRVAGVLAPTYGPDDVAVLVDLKTSWLIAGLGHGHENLSATNDPSVVLARTENNTVANAKLVQYLEVTEANVDGFHFHGDLSEFPITAVIAVPHDERAAAILRGRYIEPDGNYQLIVPAQEVNRLLESIFRIKQILNGVVAVVVTASMFSVALVFVLSYRLRRGEFATLFKIGCSRAMVVKLIAGEIALVGALSASVTAGVLLFLDSQRTEVFRALFLG